MQIFNTYGSLSNAALLHRYGFTEPNNPFDIVNIDLATVNDVCYQSFTKRYIRRCVMLWRKAGCAPCTSQGSEYFEISAEGKLQPELLMLLYIIHLPDTTRSRLETVKLGRRGEDSIEQTEGIVVARIAQTLGWTSKDLKGGSCSNNRYAMLVSKCFSCFSPLCFSLRFGVVACLPRVSCSLYGL